MYYTVYLLCTTVWVAVFGSEAQHNCRKRNWRPFNEQTREWTLNNGSWWRIASAMNRALCSSTLNLPEMANKKTLFDRPLNKTNRIPMPLCYTKRLEEYLRERYLQNCLFKTIHNTRHQCNTTLKKPIPKFNVHGQLWPIYHCCIAKPPTTA